LEKYYELIAEVVCKLAEKTVQLRIVHNSGFQGLCRADSSGMVTIDIEPELENHEKEFLEVLLHETAHAKFDNFVPASFEVTDKIPSEYYAQASNRESFRERRAETQAKVWLWYAETHRDNNLDYIEGCLLTLLEL